MTHPVELPPPHLEHLYDMHVDLEPPQPVGAGPDGNRQVFIVRGGWFEGPRMRGEVLPGGGDWARVRGPGSVRLDVRATVRTDDGAYIYAEYQGLIIIPPALVGPIMSGADVPPADYYFYTSPLFETGDERYAWLNERVAVGRGRVIPNGVEYRVWSLEVPA